MDKTMWYAYGWQRGTSVDVYEQGNTEEEVRTKLMSKSYPVEIIMVWEKDD